MSKYIKSFQNANDMKAYLNTAEGMKYYLLKNESGTEGIGDNPMSGKKIISLFKGRDYLTFTAEQANSTVKFTSSDPAWSSVEYSIDDGVTWQDAKGVTVTLVNIGDSVKYRGVLETTPSNIRPKMYLQGKIAASGSIMSMYNNNPNDTVITIRCAFKEFFHNLYEPNTLTSAPELPATTITEDCYRSMFANNKLLTTAPEIMSTNTGGNGFKEMFYDCSSLNYVKHHVEDWSYWSTENWLMGTSSTGIVECPENSTIPSNSNSGIPTGWTRVNF